ncbi:uncharacterized protein LOC111009540 isoform X2 [Momordica charantia]|uniref:Uncharacterized protein LOC111009540 isoform X2 n=1 Tax=Momordica charantia TaxID=3673 RepID=A0A6J1CCQ8_MOMCH|nr:uncharacterized protein LOC111009540 isoform X2 [Momordica charantia]
MAGKHTVNTSKGPAVDSSTPQILSPKSTTNRLLLMEDSLGEVRSNVQHIHSLLENLGRQLELIFDEQERLQTDLQHTDEANRPRNQPRPPKPPRNHDGRNRRNQELQERSQDSDTSDGDEGFLQQHPRFAREEHYVERGGVRTDFKMKIDLPTFNGKMDVETFLDRVKNVENFFDYTNTPEDKKVKLVAFKIQSGASAWWDQLEINCRRLGKQPIRSWPRMLRLMRERFLPPNFEQLLYQPYQRCRQGFKTIADYTEAFHRLGAKTNIAETEDYKIARFVDGLREDIQDQMDIQPIHLLTDAIVMATKIEDKKRLRTPARRTPWDKPSISKTATTDTGKPLQIGTTSASTTKPPDDPAKSSPFKTPDTSSKRGTNPYIRPTLGKCFRCGQVDHLSNECPQRRALALVDQDDLLETDIDLPTEDDPTYVEPDEGDLLSCVVQKVLTPKVEVQPQRNSLFRTCFTINGKERETMWKAMVQQAVQLVTRTHPRLLPKHCFASMTNIFTGRVKNRVD